MQGATLASSIIYYTTVYYYERCGVYQSYGMLCGTVRGGVSRPRNGDSMSVRKRHGHGDVGVLPHACIFDLSECQPVVLLVTYFITWFSRVVIIHITNISAVALHKVHKISYMHSTNKISIKILLWIHSFVQNAVSFYHDIAHCGCCDNRWWS